MDKMKRLNYGSILKVVYQNNIKKLFKFTKIPPKFFAGKLQNIWLIHVIALVFTSTISSYYRFKLVTMFRIYSGRRTWKQNVSPVFNMDVLISNCYKPTLICN